MVRMHPHKPLQRKKKRNQTINNTMVSTSDDGGRCGLCCLSGKLPTMKSDRRRKVHEQNERWSHYSRKQHQRQETERKGSIALLYAKSVTSTLRTTISLLLVFLISFSTNNYKYVYGSPPVDYFVYTSQIASASPGTQNVSSMLIPMESIYTSQSETQNNNNKTAALVEKVFALISNGTLHSHDNDQIDLQTTQVAWNLMQRQALLYMRNQVETLRPFILELLNEAQVSQECRKSVSDWLNELTLLKKQAVRMWNSWGQFPPSGLYEGSFTDLGSYRGCMAIDDDKPIGLGESQQVDTTIGEAQYCMLDFQPLIPTRPRFHSIFKHILGHNKETRQLTGGDFDALERISSQNSAHGFSSNRFKKLTNQPADHYDFHLNASQPAQAKQLLEEASIGPNTTLTAEVST